MNILFMGTPDFAVPCLEAIIKSGENVIGVVSQPDRPKGRGHKLMPTPVKETALTHSIPVFQPETLKNNAFLEQLKLLHPDMIVVVAYGKILPEYILDYPKFGCINVHGSLLPKYRGAAPIQRAVINGDTETGVTTMYMDKTLDTGDIIMTVRTEIGKTETAGELFDRLALMGGELIVKTIESIKNGTVMRTKQDDSGATYAAMLTKDTGHIDWSMSARDIINLIRGTNPWPVAYSLYKGETMKIYSAGSGKGVGGKPGEILDAGTKTGITVACGDGSVCIDELQFKGKKRMSASSYLNGHNVDMGTILM